MKLGRVDAQNKADIRCGRRLLLYTLNFPPELTGVGKFNGEFVKWLANRGWEIDVVCAPPYYPEWAVHDGYSSWRYASSEEHNCRVLRTPIWVPRSPNGIKRILHLASFAAFSFPALVLKSLLRRPTVIILTQPPLIAAPGCLIAARLSKAISWMHVQDLEVDAAQGLGIVSGGKTITLVLALEAALLRRFQVISTISNAMSRKILAKLRDDRKVYLWPNWVDTENIAPLGRASEYRELLGIGKDSVVALYSGNLGKKQGVHLLVDLAKRVASNSNSIDIQFVICGQGVEFEPLRNATANLQNVKWLPLQPYERLNELLGMADIHLLPQLAGAADAVMPSKLSSMLATGIPVLACADEGTELHSFASKGGICVRPGDLDEMESRLYLLAGDKKLRQELGRSGRNCAEESLSMTEIMRAFESELEEKIGLKGARTKTPHLNAEEHGNGS